MFNQKKFNVVLKRHKTLISAMAKEKKTDLLVGIQRTGKELALAFSGCKCEKCGSKEKLQLHHLIPKSVKTYTEKWRYRSQRHYWANIIVLCEKDHRILEGRAENDTGKCITEKLISRIERKYFK